jgi:hypothetical protein
MSSEPIPVIAWLMYTRDTKRELHYSVGTAPNVNIIDKSGRKRLEISLHLSLLLTAFPKLEILSLVNPDIAMSDACTGYDGSELSLVEGSQC